MLMGSNGKVILKILLIFILLIVYIDKREVLFSEY
jgi:hypothetical protein